MSRAEHLYGWVMVFAAAILIGLGIGGIASIAIILKPLAAEFGWSRANVSLAYTVASIATAVVGVYFGRVADQHGVRLLAWIGTLTFGLSLIALSFQTSLWHLYAGFAIFGGLGISTTLIPLTSSVSLWFDANRGLAVGVATAGASVGQALVPLIAGLLVVDFGWRDTFLYLGIGFLVIGIPVAILVRDPVVKSGNAGSMSGPAIDRDISPSISPSPAIAWISFAAIFCCFCMSVPLVHVAALANDVGISPEHAAGVLTTLLIAGAAGRVIVGRLADRTSALLAYMLASFTQTVAVLWFTQMTSVTGFYVVAIVFGTGFGGVMTSFLLTIRSLVPTNMAGLAMAIVILFAWTGMGLGAYIGGLLFDLSGNYFASFALAAVAGVINLSITSALFIRLRRVRARAFG
jgi:MFS family permease